MTVRIRLEGSKALQSALRNMSDDVRDAVSQEVLATAVEMRADIVESIKKPGTGTMYYRIFNAENNTTTIFAGDSEGYVGTFSGRLGKSETHQASASGMPPATDTGRLINSIEFDRIGDTKAIVGSNLIYAAYLEYGTLTMAARPFFRPAVERARVDFSRNLEAAIKRATR